MFLRSVPIQLVQLLSVSADGSETIVNSPSIALTETAGETAFDSGSGVACLASVNGTFTPPDMRIMMDNTDVTRMFLATTQSRIFQDPESSGLGVYYGERKLSYVTPSPETNWDGRMLTCVASQEGFPDESVFAMVVVESVSTV